MWRSGCNALARSLRQAGPAVEQSTGKAAQVRIGLRRLTVGNEEDLVKRNYLWRGGHDLLLCKLTAAVKTSSETCALTCSSGRTIEHVRIISSTLFDFERNRDLVAHPPEITKPRIFLQNAPLAATAAGQSVHTGAAQPEGTSDAGTSRVWAKYLTGGVLAAGVGGLGFALAEDEAEHGLHPPQHPWSHNGLFSSYDHAAIRRGHQVYSQASATNPSCHRLAVNKRFALSAKIVSRLYPCPLLLAT